MTFLVSANVDALRHLPLFRSLSLSEFDELIGALRPRRVSRGTTLFREGEVATEFHILVEGSVELSESNEPQVVLHPCAPIGELGALTGLPRNTTAVVAADALLLELPVSELHNLFARSNGLAVAFYRALLDVVGDKVRRDKTRIDEMRTNLIRTQKAMKELRELVLSSAETPLSQPVCDRLDDLIEHNRRGHYRAVPVRGHDASLRLKSGAMLQVVELSEGYLKLAPSKSTPTKGELSGVLCLPGGELPVGGRVERSGPDGALVKLDLLIEEHQAALAAYRTELQMLDLVV
jgi:CRP/FNR family cyclic AMP-dependent transcriptional regulator